MSRLARTRLGRSTIAAALAALVLVAVPAAAGAEPAAAGAEPAAAVHPASTATVSGTVRDSRGNALGGWTVWFVPGIDVTQAQSTLADGSGHYSIDLPTGTSWSTAITAPGSSITDPGPGSDGADAGIGYFQVDSPTSLDFTLPLVAVTVTVVDGGDPVAGATVSAPAVVADPLATLLTPGASTSQGWRSAQSATTDANGQATLDLLALAAPWSASVTATPPSPSLLQPKTITVSDLTTDSAHTVDLAPPGPTVTVTGVIHSQPDIPAMYWSVAFMPGDAVDQATIVSVAADGSYTAQVPESDDTVELFDGDTPDAAGSDFVRSGGLALSGPTTLDLTEPLVAVHVHVGDSDGRPVDRTDLFTSGVGTAAAPVPTGHLFAGSTGDVGAQGSTDTTTDAAGDATLGGVLQSSAPSTIRGYYSETPCVDPGLIPFTPSADQSLTITLQLCSVVPGVGSVVAPTSGTAQLQIPVTLASASDNSVYVPWSTAVIPNALPGQAPQSDYVAASGTLVFLPGQTTPTTPITITVNGNSSGGDEYIPIGFHDVTGAEVGGGPLHLAYGFIDAAEPNGRARSGLGRGAGVGDIGGRRTGDALGAVRVHRDRALGDPVADRCVPGACRRLRGDERNGDVQPGPDLGHRSHCGDRRQHRAGGVRGGVVLEPDQRADRRVLGARLRSHRRRHLRHPAAPVTDSVELRRIELLTSSMPWKRSTN